MCRALGTHAVRVGWKLAEAAWVAAPIVGWWPGASPQSGQLGWWVFASIWVMGLGMLQPLQRPVPMAAGLLGSCLAVASVHLWTGMGWTVVWLYQATLILMAWWMLAERGSWQRCWRWIRWLAWTEVLIVGLQLFGVDLPWGIAKEPAGTLHRRSALGVLWGAVALWDTRWSGRMFLLLALLAGSFSGFTLPLLRTLSRAVSRPWLIGLGIALGAGASVWWWPKLVSRLEAWGFAQYVFHGWLTGWGFRPFMGGFQELASTGPTGQIDLHNVWFEWVARGGLVGLLSLAGVARWVVRRVTTADERWALAMVVWVGLWQSAEAFPVLILLGLVWMMRLAQREGGCPT